MMTEESVKLKVAYSVKEAAAALGVSAAFLYRYIENHPEFPHRRMEGRIVIPIRRLVEYVNSAELD